MWVLPSYPPQGLVFPRDTDNATTEAFVRTDFASGCNADQEEANRKLHTRVIAPRKVIETIALDLANILADVVLRASPWSLSRGV